MRFNFYLILSCIILFGCQPSENIPTIQQLNTNWSFKNVKDTTWLSAKVPGEVHSDLFTNEKIKDPFVANNELDLQWISKEDWEYRSTFLLDEKTLQRKHIELDFKGLDTYATVYLNDTEILKTNNAFREFLVDIKSLVQKENNIRIVFESTTKAAAIEKAKLAYELPAGDRIFIRKPQFHYGWDWGPILTSSGISKPIILKTWDDLKIKDVFVKQNTLTDAMAELSAEFELQSTLKDSLTVDVFVNNKLHTSQNISAESANSSIPFTIENPEKWWPHNIGTPYLYDLRFVIKQGSTTLDSYQLKKGLRTIKLVTEKDSIGESFYFTVNDVPVYAKGANYIPQHSFQNQLTDDNYTKLIQDALDANMNMLRVWGGGIYEEDLFYDLCDEKGILVWQDFMFACAMYPGDNDFMENVKYEAIDNIKRLRNHASIALWCGNNENNEAWHRWGWQTGRSEEEKDEIWGNYLNLFDKLLPELVSQYTDTDYWESSPRYGRGNPKYKTEGDAHDWWIWHNEYPFEHLLDAVPRFMSEFGFQSFPSYEAIKYINGNDSITVSSKAFDTHQKHPRGYSIIKNYMERDYPVPSKDEDYVYISQVLQGNGMAMGFEAQRRARPYNMGTLYWQLNDCWPVVSWSSIDFLGNWKAMHYKTKKAFADILVSSRVLNDTLNTYVVNDKLESQTGTLHIKIIDFKGNTIHKESKEIVADANDSKLHHRLNLKTINNMSLNDVVIVSSFNNTENYHYLARPKELNLIKETIDQKITKVDKGFSIEISSKVLQKEVFLFSNHKGHFSDNFFDLMANTSKTILFETDAESIDNLTIKSLNNIQ